MRFTRLATPRVTIRGPAPEAHPLPAAANPWEENAARLEEPPFVVPPDLVGAVLEMVKRETRRTI